MRTADITLPCMKCGRDTPCGLLDGKPSNSKFLAEVKKYGQEEAIAMAGDRNDDFDRIECESCYGPGWQRGA